MSATRKDRQTATDFSRSEDFAWRYGILNVGLSSASPAPIAPLGDAAWRELMSWTEQNRLVGFLARFVEDAPLSPVQREEVVQKWQLSAVTTLGIEASVPRIFDAFSGASIDWRVLKGIATSRLLYAESGLRTFGDIDILVRPADLARALEALLPITATKATPLHGPTRSKALQERQVTDFRGVEIDLHRAVEGSLVTSRLPVEFFFSDPQELRISGRTVTAPSTEASLVHAIIHLSSAGRRLSTVPDIARMVRLVSPDHPTVRAMLSTATSKALGHWALRTASEWTPLPQPWKDYSAEIAPNPVVQNLVNWVQDRPDRSSFANTFLGGNRGRRAIETLWPDDEFLRFMGTTHTGHLRHLLTKAVGLEKG